MTSLQKPIITLLFLVLINSYPSGTDNSLQYLGQTPPSMTPEIFAPGLISKSTEYEFGSVFSKDGMEFFYGVDTGNRSEIRYTRLENGKWTPSKTIISHQQYGYNDPFLSPDENELYYISDMPMNGKGSGKDYDIWYSVRNGDKWSEPINAGKNINSDKNEYYISFTEDGSMYFSSNKMAENGNDYNFDIYSSARRKGEYQEAVKLSDAVNTGSYEADVFIAPDESYIIFCANRKEGLGRGDLYISFKDENGNWTKSKNMGSLINTNGHELCPFVSRDGKYFFYTSRQDIYWVDAKILEQYR
ncbi:hypothetical protein GWK08_02110 [Leptobacterium flavescens]|uniref:Exo-alpha-sialidase n=1 Tax=Leptobacterium flavescens TaxID=472055 RepID=A0A6P0UG59_9FLAO|nr:PD40 domain-containing protein [Leptobacterium flavescens]NER12225.1 hypothetical protein [Leptobacterium flavescens]